MGETTFMKVSQVEDTFYAYRTKTTAVEGGSADLKLQ
jgi:hypothetical protein